MATAHEVGLKTTSTIMFGHLDQPHHWYTFAILSGERCTHVSSPFIFKENHLITSRSLWIQGQAFAAIEKFGKGDWWFHRVCSSSLCAHGGLNLSKWLLTPFHISFLNLDMRCYTVHCKIPVWHSYKNHVLAVAPHEIFAEPLWIRQQMQGALPWVPTPAHGRCHESIIKRCGQAMARSSIIADNVPPCIQLGIETSTKIAWPDHYRCLLFQLSSNQCAHPMQFLSPQILASQAPIYLKGRSRKGPTSRECVLMHSIARLVLHPFITNIQVIHATSSPQAVDWHLLSCC